MMGPSDKVWPVLSSAATLPPYIRCHAAGNCPDCKPDECATFVTDLIQPSGEVFTSDPPCQNTLNETVRVAGRAVAAYFTSGYSEFVGPLVDDATKASVDVVRKHLNEINLGGTLGSNISTYTPNDAKTMRDVPCFRSPLRHPLQLPAIGSKRGTIAERLRSASRGAIAPEAGASSSQNRTPTRPMRDATTTWSSRTGRIQQHAPQGSLCTFGLARVGFRRGSRRFVQRASFYGLSTTRVAPERSDLRADLPPIHSSGALSRRQPDWRSAQRSGSVSAAN